MFFIARVGANKFTEKRVLRLLAQCLYANGHLAFISSPTSKLTNTINQFYEIISAIFSLERKFWNFPPYTELFVLIFFYN